MNTLFYDDHSRNGGTVYLCEGTSIGPSVGTFSALTNLDGVRYWSYSHGDCFSKHRFTEPCNCVDVAPKLSRVDTDFVNGKARRRTFSSRAALIKALNRAIA